MTRSSPGTSDGVDRRSFLAAGLVGALGATSGCIDQVQSATGQGPTNRLSISLSTVPADDDREAIQIVRALQANLEAVGVGVSIDVRSRSEFLERILVDHDFDVFVGRLPAPRDPDDLYEYLHSTFTHEVGWQNPFGFTSLTFDELLERQRRDEGDDRKAVVENILTRLTAEKPFVPICVPEEHRFGRTDRFEGWSDGHLATRHGYLEPSPHDGVTELRATVTDDLPSGHLDPVSAGFREQPMVVDLVYDSLATERDGELEPWLAASWAWNPGSLFPSNDPSDETDSLTATIELRRDCHFHDGAPVTAHDVAFSYRFLADATLGRSRTDSPPPRYRGRLSAVEAVELLDDYSLAIEVTTSEAVGERAFTVPILPKHLWGERVEKHYDGVGHVTGAEDNWGHHNMGRVPPIGSGPYRVADRSERDYLELERFEEHFTLDHWVDLAGPPVESLRFDIDPGSAAATGRVEAGSADVTASPLRSHVIDEAPEGPDIEHFESTPRSLYLVGFNSRRRPFSNTHFRRAVARLLDRESIVETVFQGHAEPVAAPLPEEWIPEDLQWSGADPVTPFPGDDGDLDVEEARNAFESAGYRYDDQDRLLEGH